MRWHRRFLLAENIVITRTGHRARLRRGTHDLGAKEDHQVGLVLLASVVAEQVPVSVDGPQLPSLFPRLDVVTNPAFFYARLYGRNAAGWRSGHLQRRFDYRYGAAQLAEWIEVRMAAMAGRARRGLIFFNNHVRAQAAADARQLIRLLDDRGLVVEASA